MNNSNDEEIMSILTGVSLRLDSIGVLLEEVKLLYGFDETVQEPPVPSEPISEPFGEPGPRLPSFEEMRESEAATSVVGDDLEVEGQLE